MEEVYTLREMYSIPNVYFSHKKRLKDIFESNSYNDRVSLFIVLPPYSPLP